MLQQHIPSFLLRTSAHMNCTTRDDLLRTFDRFYTPPLYWGPVIESPCLAWNIKCCHCALDTIMYTED